MRRWHKAKAATPGTARAGNGRPQARQVGASATTPMLASRSGRGLAVARRARPAGRCARRSAARIRRGGRSDLEPRPGGRAADPHRPTLRQRRLERQSVVGVPRPSSTCSTRARCCAWRRASKATPRPRRGCASPCSSGSTPRRRATTSRSTPKRRRRRSRPRARACARPDAPLERHPAGPPLADRRERLRGRPQRRHDRRRGGVRERALPAARVHAADGQGLRAADAVRAAVHQQVLHPRPAARELADPPHRRRRATASSS